MKQAEEDRNINIQEEEDVSESDGEDVYYEKIKKKLNKTEKEDSKLAKEKLKEKRIKKKRQERKSKGTLRDGDDGPVVAVLGSGSESAAEESEVEEPVQKRQKTSAPKKNNMTAEERALALLANMDDEI